MIALKRPTCPARRGRLPYLSVRRRSRFTLLFLADGETEIRNPHSECPYGTRSECAATSEENFLQCDRQRHLSAGFGRRGRSLVVKIERPPVVRNGGCRVTRFARVAHFMQVLTSKKLVKMLTWNVRLMGISL
jgi:hypothetical protein